MCLGDGCVGACVRACVRACVWRYFAVVCEVSFQSKHAGVIPPGMVIHSFLLLLFLWMVTNSQMCMSEFVIREKKKEEEREMATY